MSHILKVGILALQGGVIEHIQATQKAASILQKNKSIRYDIVEVRTREDLKDLRGLMIPGGESTVLHKLCEREDMMEEIKKVPVILGTCAGAIMLAKKIQHAEIGQKTLGLMDIEVDRNAYGRQNDSFETRIVVELPEKKKHSINAVFIRAPHIMTIGKNVHTLAKYENRIIACEETVQDQQEKTTKKYIAICFHPEMTTTIFHQYFLQSL